MAMMTRKEADLLLESNARFINMELAKYFKNRSAEDIKKVSRRRLTGN